MPFREVSNKITTSNCPKYLFHYSHFCLHIIVIFLSKYNNVLDSKSLYVSSVTLSTTRTIENTCTNNWNWNEELSFDDSVEDNEPCCICGVVEPAALKTQSYIEFVNWAQCHLFEHWVHLKFCVPQRVLRKDTIIVCPHCKT